MIQKNNIYKNRNYALYVFMLIPFFRPLGLELKVLPFINTIFLVWELCAIFLFAIMQVENMRFLQVGKSDEFRFLKLYSVFTFLNSITMKFLFGNKEIPLVTLLMFCSCFFIVSYIAQRDCEVLIDILYKYFSVINIINTLFIIVPRLNTVFSDDFYYFNGHRQSMSMLWAISVFLCLIRSALFREKNGKYRKWGVAINVGIATFNLFQVFSTVATAIFAFSVFIILYIALVIFKKINSIHDLALYCTFIGGLIINYLVVAFNIQNNFAAFLSNYLGESISLSGRTTIFKEFFQAFTESSIFGYGFYGVKCNIGWVGWEEMGYAHNTLLQELTGGGLVGLILFIVMGLYAVKNACKIRNIYIKKVTLCALAANMVIMITESTNQYNYFTLFLIIITCIYKLDLQSNSRCLRTKEQGE